MQNAAFLTACASIREKITFSIWVNVALAVVWKKTQQNKIMLWTHFCNYVIDKFSATQKQAFSDIVFFIASIKHNVTWNLARQDFTASKQKVYLHASSQDPFSFPVEFKTRQQTVVRFRSLFTDSWNVRWSHFLVAALSWNIQSALMGKTFLVLFNINFPDKVTN